MRPRISIAIACMAVLAAALLMTTLPANSKATKDPFAEKRKVMVREHLRARGITDRAVLKAMGKVERHEFVPANARHLAYADHPLPIGKGQTISQPFVVALMTQAIEPRAGQKVLEIGTGSGYQAAVLAEIVGEVYTIEIVPELAEEARQRLERLGYANVHVKAGDGFYGWPEAAPFDSIIVTAATERVPKRLMEQLKEGGMMVLPLGPTNTFQYLTLIINKPDGPEMRYLSGVRFVPMTGKIRE